MGLSMEALTADLEAETAELKALLRDLPADGWTTMTPAEGWSIRDQIAHLAYFDDVALLALRAPEDFRRLAESHVAGGMDFPDRLVADHRLEYSISKLHAWFVSSRTRLIAASRDLDPGQRVPWYGPDMSAASCVTARIMETWAHGQDVVDALGIARVPTDRLRHVAHLGVNAMPYSYRVRNLEVPSDPIRVELEAPGGTTWCWGPDSAVNVVYGPALDLCLVVTQRRHHLDTNLRTDGFVARQWVSIAQAFAGAAGPGRAPVGARRLVAVPQQRTGPRRRTLMWRRRKN